MGSNLTHARTILHKVYPMIRNRLQHRFLSSLIALAIFASGMVMAFHHHAVEAKGADHCSVCVVGHQARACDAPTYPGLALVGGFFAISLADFESPFLPVSVVLLGKRSQAPPLV